MHRNETKTNRIFYIQISLLYLSSILVFIVFQLTRVWMMWRWRQWTRWWRELNMVSSWGLSKAKTKKTRSVVIYFTYKINVTPFIRPINLCQSLKVLISRKQSWSNVSVTLKNEPEKTHQTTVCFISTCYCRFPHLSEHLSRSQGHFEVFCYIFTKT